MCKWDGTFSNILPEIEGGEASVPLARGPAPLAGVYRRPSRNSDAFKKLCIKSVLTMYCIRFVLLKIWPLPLLCNRQAGISIVSISAELLNRIRISTTFPIFPNLPLILGIFSLDMTRVELQPELLPTLRSKVTSTYSIGLNPIPSRDLPLTCLGLCPVQLYFHYSRSLAHHSCGYIFH